MTFLYPKLSLTTKKKKKIVQEDKRVTRYSAIVCVSVCVCVCVNNKGSQTQRCVWFRTVWYTLTGLFHEATSLSFFQAELSLHLQKCFTQ